MRGISPTLLKDMSQLLDKAPSAWMSPAVGLILRGSWEDLFKPQGLRHVPHGLLQPRVVTKGLNRCHIGLCSLVRVPTPPRRSVNETGLVLGIGRGLF